jgi:ParB-like chromosome segregation protein Spo0J
LKGWTLRLRSPEHPNEDDGKVYRILGARSADAKPAKSANHSDAQIAQMTGSVLAFGFNSPILIDARGCIIAGHGRYLAALNLGLETVPVIVLDHLAEIEKRVYLLADNKLAELSDWDDDTLASELAELKNADIALGDLGFSDEELRLLMADAELPDTRPP